MNAYHATTKDMMDLIGKHDGTEELAAATRVELIRAGFGEAEVRDIPKDAVADAIFAAAKTIEYYD